MSEMRDLEFLLLAQGEQSSEKDYLHTLRIQTWWAVRPRRPRSKLRPGAIKRNRYKSAPMRQRQTRNIKE